MNAHTNGIYPILDGLYCATLTRDQFQRTLAGGVFAGNLTAVNPGEDLVASLNTIASLLRVVSENTDLARIVTSVAEIKQAKNDGVLGIIIGSQDATFMQDNLEMLRVLHRMGLRILQPVYNAQNRFGSGGLVDPPSGLTREGYEWVAMMNNLRMLTDISHASYPTARDVIRISKRPVIFSHSNARVLCDSPRNIPDELIRAVATTGGTVGVTMWPPLLGIKNQPTLEDFASQIDHMVNLAGIEHVAFGSDLSEGTKTREVWVKLYGSDPLWPPVTGICGEWYTYEGRATPGFFSMAEAGNLVGALRKRGYKEDALEKIMSANLLRVYEEVWGE
ncbi:MAG TPA: membrane dipeptidase [Rhizobiaceae bacterium]|nr:membrane dipeptidase [Rhizobiaceae bacterium]